jgi:hypothetical protein
MNLQEVNEWLEENYINTRLTDSDLKIFYLNNDNVKKNIKELETILKNNNVTNRQIANIVIDYFSSLIPSEIRQSTREKVFNRLIKDKLEVDLDPNIYFVGKYKEGDWYVKNKITENSILGFNYPHLFNGEQQFQKLKKNVYRNDLTLNVLCNPHRFLIEDKFYEVIRDGIQRENVCYYDEITEYIQRLI